MSSPIVDGLGGTGRFVVISGCSGGGKSTLLNELERRGYSVIDEPGRRIVAEEVRTSGTALPWIDMAAFAARAMELARRDREKVAGSPGIVFFDRGLIDAACALETATGTPVLNSVSEERYHRRVFMTPPWPEIYVADAARRHGLQDAIEEYDRLLTAYSGLGYAVEILAKVSVAERADWLIDRLRA